jgi:1,6-anhydro-N-acetylmuramate kinase
MGWVTAIELMSGTSYDGIDVALVETDGEETGHLGATESARSRDYRSPSPQRRECRARLRGGILVP